MHVEETVPVARRAILALAGIGSAVLLAISILGVGPAFGDTTGGGGPPGSWGVMAFQLSTIAKGQSSVTVNPGVQLLKTSAAICTLESNPGVRYLKYAQVDPSHGTYTVFLSGVALTPIQVGCTIVTSFPPISGPISGPISKPISGPISGP